MTKVININGTTEMVEVFNEFLDSLYWEGYARHLAAENPERYDFELNQFLNNYHPMEAV